MLPFDEFVSLHANKQDMTQGSTRNVQSLMRDGVDSILGKACGIELVCGCGRLENSSAIQDQSKFDKIVS